MVKIKKVGFVWKVTAAVIAVAVFLYYLLRRVDIPVVSKLTDKIANVFLTGSVEQIICDAALQRLSLKFPAVQAAVLSRLMVAQSKHETGNYTSNVYKKNKNCFGYLNTDVSIYDLDNGVGTARPKSEGGSYEVYGNIADSSREVADWLGRRKSDFINVVTTDQYAQALKKCGYYADPVYVYADGLKKFYIA